jgi:hypothetical protein
MGTKIERDFQSEGVLSGPCVRRQHSGGWRAAAYALSFTIATLTMLESSPVSAQASEIKVTCSGAAEPFCDLRMFLAPTTPGQPVDCGQPVGPCDTNFMLFTAPANTCGPIDQGIVNVFNSPACNVRSSATAAGFQIASSALKHWGVCIQGAATEALPLANGPVSLCGLTFSQTSTLAVPGLPPLGRALLALGLALGGLVSLGRSRLLRKRHRFSP